MVAPAVRFVGLGLEAVDVGLGVGEVGGVPSVQGSVCSGDSLAAPLHPFSATTVLSRPTSGGNRSEHRRRFTDPTGVVPTLGCLGTTR